MVVEELNGNWWVLVHAFIDGLEIIDSQTGIEYYVIIAIVLLV
jgi:hypothetical protein